MRSLSRLLFPALHRLHRRARMRHRHPQDAAARLRGPPLAREPAPPGDRRHCHRPDRGRPARGAGCGLHRGEARADDRHHGGPRPHRRRRREWCSPRGSPRPATRISSARSWTAAAGMPFLGPNCNGYVNFMSKAVLWPDEYGGGPCACGVAIVAQSGNIAVNLTMLRRSLPVAGVFALGNQADVDLAQMVEASGRRTSASPPSASTSRACAMSRPSCRPSRRRGRLKKPVVALKTGRSAAGARITLSHTDSLSGEDALYDALFRRLGVARVSTITAFAETLKFLHVGGPATGTRLVSMSCSGGEAALVADLAEGRGVGFPALRRGRPDQSRGDAQRTRHGRQPARLPDLHLGRRGQARRDLYGRARRRLRHRPA